MQNGHKVMRKSYKSIRNEHKGTQNVQKEIQNSHKGMQNGYKWVQNSQKRMQNSHRGMDAKQAQRDKRYQRHWTQNYNKEKQNGHKALIRCVKRDPKCPLREAKDTKQPQVDEIRPHRGQKHKVITDGVRPRGGRLIIPVWCQMALWSLQS